MSLNILIIEFIEDKLEDHLLEAWRMLAGGKI